MTRTSIVGLTFIVLAQLSLAAHSAPPVGTLETTSPCVLAAGQTTCTTNITWNTKNASYICLWNNNSLSQCQGNATWNTTYIYNNSSPTNLQLRSHPIWPTSDPDWPNIAAVLAKSTLLDQRAAVGVACTSTLAQGGNLQNAINNLVPPATLCLQAGSTAFSVSQTINVPRNVTIKGLGTTPSNTLITASSSLVGAMFWIGSGKSNVSMSNLQIKSNGASQSDVNATNISVDGASNVLLDHLNLSNTFRMNVAINGSNSVTVASSSFSQMGFDVDAQGAMWINNSPNVVVEANTIVGRNNGPGGDGGIDCYGGTGFVAKGNTLSNTGESSIYSTNNPTSGQTACYDASILFNTISGSSEWGVDTRGFNGAKIENNTISTSYFGAVSLWDASNTSVQYDAMNGNDRVNLTHGCNGVNKQGTQSSNTVANNTGNATLVCTYSP